MKGRVWRQHYIVLMNLTWCMQIKIPKDLLLTLKFYLFLYWYNTTEFTEKFSIISLLCFYCNFVLGHLSKEYSLFYWPQSSAKSSLTLLGSFQKKYWVFLTFWLLSYLFLSETSLCWRSDCEWIMQNQQQYRNSITSCPVVTWEGNHDCFCFRFLWFYFFNFAT